MFSGWPIRKKLLLGISLLVLIVSTLAFSGFRGVYAYRGLVRSMRHRIEERPLARDLARRVSELRVEIGQLQQIHEETREAASIFPREAFRARFSEVQIALKIYQQWLDQNRELGPSFGDNRDEWETVHKLQSLVDGIDHLDRDQNWWLQDVDMAILNDQLEELHQLSAQLPKFHDERVRQYTYDVRAQYRTWIALTWVTSLAALMLLGLLARLFYVWIFQPLQLLIDGSRYVARGNFQHRIELNTDDEMSELSKAMNAMTQHFQNVRNELDEQVELKTKQVVRSEQLASVGFLAAGVAHEINNPLASISLCAESLEMRLHDIMQADDVKNDDEHNQEITVTRNYLRMIQDEAFRCKQITEKLLDFSRKGDSQRHVADLRELVQSVIDMAAHIGQYKGKTIRFHADAPVCATVNPQEMKQVVLNLITNACDSVDVGGIVDVEVKLAANRAVILVTDDGCGMTEEVQKHLFDPFFTRRRDGQGTGLGLTISHRIISEHNGSIDMTSGGPGQGSQFQISLPATLAKQKEKYDQYQAA